MTYTVYSTTSTVVIRSLQCDDDFKDSVHSRYYRDAYLYADYSVSCKSNRYALHRVYAILMVFCYPVGIPFVNFFMLLGAKDTIAPSNITLLAERIVKETEHVGADIQRERREVTKFLEHGVVVDGEDVDVVDDRERRDLGPRVEVRDDLRRAPRLAEPLRAARVPAQVLDAERRRAARDRRFGDARGLERREQHALVLPLEPPRRAEHDVAGRGVDDRLEAPQELGVQRVLAGHLRRVEHAVDVEE